MSLTSPNNPFDGWDNDDALKSSLTTSDPFGNPSPSPQADIFGNSQPNSNSMNLNQLS